MLSTGRRQLAVCRRAAVEPVRCASPCGEGENAHRWRVAIAYRLRALAGFGVGGWQCLFLFHAHPDAAPPGEASAPDLHSDGLGATYRRTCVRHFAPVAYGADANRHRTPVARPGFQKAAAKNRLSRKASHLKSLRFGPLLHQLDEQPDHANPSEHEEDGTDEGNRREKHDCVRDAYPEEARRPKHGHTVVLAGELDRDDPRRKWCERLDGIEVGAMRALT